MTQPEITISGAELLGLFPPFIRIDIADDEAFRDLLGLKFDGTVTVEFAVRFKRSTFFNAIRRFYKNPGKTASVKDEDKVSWTLGLGGGDDPGAIRLEAGERKLLVRNFASLSPDKATRTKGFEKALEDAGLPPDALGEWRKRAERGAFNDEEERDFRRDLERTPISAIHRLNRALNGPDGDIETIISPHRAYYEILTGSEPATDIDEYASKVACKAARSWLAWDELKGAQMTLLLSSHSAIVERGPLVELSEGRLLELAGWAVEKGDCISKIGMIELGLACLRKAPSLEPKLIELIAQVRDLDPDDENGRLHFLSALIILALGELSRTQIFDDWPPFRRRIAALAAASLVERTAFGRLEVAAFSKWAMEERGHRFYLQSLVDLRAEPRWIPDQVTPDDLKFELLGRVLNAAGRFKDNVSDGPLYQLLFGLESDDLPARVNLRSFLPGPIEGATTHNPMPPEFEELLDQSLSTEVLTPESVIALINLRGLYAVGGEKINKAVKLIRDGGYRFSGTLETDKRNQLLLGLAAVASTMRSPDLAADLRIMVRKIRVDGDNPLPREMLVALVAAAAHEDFASWAEFIGSWGTELAFNVGDREAGQELMSELVMLCTIQPELRRYVGRAIAAVGAFLDT